MPEKAAESRAKRWLRFEVGVFVLAIFFVVVIHRAAMEDRLLLILYYLGTVGAAYALLKRRAFGLAAVVGTVVAATIFASTYYAAEPEVWHPLLDPARDMAGLAILLFITAKIVIELYRYEKEERQRHLAQIMEKRSIAMRAAALQATSHEVRTPLTTVMALTEMLLDESAGPLNEVQQEFIQDIDSAGRHLLELVNDILDYAKAEAGMLKLAPEPVAVLGLVEQCVGMMGPRADAAGVNVSAHVAQGLKEIVADPLRLKQILLNLLSNAVKFSDRGGSVNVRVRPDGDDSVLIAVRDTGPGIGPEHIKHLFDPYYQTAVADQSIGTGLGLAIIKHLTGLHGGTVEVESVVGAGSVFLVRLPKEAAAETSDESPLGAFGAETGELVSQALESLELSESDKQQISSLR